MDSLLFPVKPAALPRRAFVGGLLRVTLFGVPLGCAGFACGYTPIHSPESGFGVFLKRNLVPEPGLVRALLRACELTLAEHGALEPKGQARLGVEVLRLDEVARAVAARGGAPRARGVGFVLRARADVVTANRVERAGGDVVRATEAGAHSGLSLDRDAALSLLGAEVGRALANLALGVPTPRHTPL